MHIDLLNLRTETLTSEKEELLKTIESMKLASASEIKCLEKKHSEEIESLKQTHLKHLESEIDKGQCYLFHLLLYNRMTVAHPEDILSG